MTMIICSIAVVSNGVVYIDAGFVGIRSHMQLLIGIETVVHGGVGITSVGICVGISHFLDVEARRPFIIISSLSTQKSF